MLALTTAGERVIVDSAVPRFQALLQSAAPGELVTPPAASPEPTVCLTVQDGPAFDATGWTLVSRGVWARAGRALLEDACSSGFDLLVDPRADVLHVTARYRPAPRTRLANTVLATRFRLLAAQTLLHYPVLWWASLRGRAPLHVSVSSGTDGVAMLAGPSGVGKSTLVAAGIARGDVVTADNVCACDARSAYGLVEPLRVEGGAAGPRAPHGRREYPLPGRAPRLEPDLLVVVRRAERGQRASVRPVSADDAVRELVAGTYAAGELRRFWGFAAMLALATGLGPAHPPVTEVATALAVRLPRLEMRLAHGSRAPLCELLGSEVDA
ncbi:MAG TPA: hypothetical protein VF053_09570 [Streptosporangiales bacterium]